MGESVVRASTGGSVAGRFANVFYERVKHVSLLWGLFPRDVLGDAIAHELGHLLLGPQHSDRGIMNADWTRQDLTFSSGCQL